MGNFRKVLLDILAFPVKLYEKLTDRKSTLIAGIVLVGAIDLLLPDVKFIIKELFLGKSVPDTVYNAGMAVLVLLLMDLSTSSASVCLFRYFQYLKERTHRREHRHWGQGTAARAAAFCDKGDENIHNVAFHNHPGVGRFQLLVYEQCR